MPIPARPAMQLAAIPLALLLLAALPRSITGQEGAPVRATSPLVIKLDGEWRFAVDPGDLGVSSAWYADVFDDSSWRSMLTGTSWKKQGVEHHGNAWFRRTLTLPATYAGSPLFLRLGENQSDDEVWFNGVRVGGLEGKYKYRNLMRRHYTVPAALLRYGGANTLAVRVWGGNLGFIEEASQGLVEGTFSATLDPCYTSLRTADGSEQPVPGFDLSQAQRGVPLEVIVRFPAAHAGPGASAQCELKDFGGVSVASLPARLEPGADGIARAYVPIDAQTAQTLYLRARFKVSLRIKDGAGKLVHTVTKDLDHFSFAERDALRLPPLPATSADTPYGRLKLVDEIDCSLPLSEEPHPYLQSGFDKYQLHCTPGSAVEVTVSEILGKKARQSGYGWFAYRIGRGALKPHGTYLLRIEYPEDKPRYCPIEIQAGRNFMDIGWQNGVSADDPYDPWPLSGTWNWYDTIVPLDDLTTGTSGTYGARIENGFWIYFMNKVAPGKYYTMYEGGPAISRIQLYEIDAEVDAPRITLPDGLPQRVLMFDWERQAEMQAEDQVRFARLMGYNAISPVIIKWGLGNWSEPLNGYHTNGEDSRQYWVNADYAPGTAARAAVPGPSQHAAFLAATKRHGIRYVPRIEYGGSLDLPVEARAIARDGSPAKPNRFFDWSADLLHPATWDDLARLADHLIKPYVQDHPQLAGLLWRSRQDRTPISYSRTDLELFAAETGTLAQGSERERRAWAGNAGRAAYDEWWSGKRAQFHGRLAKLLQSHRSDLKLWYYNWDSDKFSLIQQSTTSWAFNSQVAGAKDGRAVYMKEREQRRQLTSADYLDVMRSGDFGKAHKLAEARVDYAIRPEHYRGITGVELFAPAPQLCYYSDAFIGYFKTSEGVAVSNAVMYDEIGSRTINPRYEGNMISPAGPAFSMALEVLGWFHGDARTLSFTTYTSGRGFAEAHRRFAQAFLALPAIEGRLIATDDPDVRIRLYPSRQGSYLGVAYKGMTAKTLTLRLTPADLGDGPSPAVKDLVSGRLLPTTVVDGGLQVSVEAGPMSLHAFLVR